MRIGTAREIDQSQPHVVPDDFNLLRFLKADKFDSAAALKRLLATIRWRQQNEIDDLPTNPPECLAYYKTCRGRCKVYEAQYNPDHVQYQKNTTWDMIRRDDLWWLRKSGSSSAIRRFLKASKCQNGWSVIPMICRNCLMSWGKVLSEKVGLPTMLQYTLIFAWQEGLFRKCALLETSRVSNFTRCTKNLSSWDCLPGRLTCISLK